MSTTLHMMLQLTASLDLGYRLIATYGGKGIMTALRTSGRHA